MPEANLLDQATQASGSVASLAADLGITNKAVYQWRKRGIPAPWQRVIRSEILKQKHPVALAAVGVAAIKQVAA